MGVPGAPHPYAFAVARFLVQHLTNDSPNGANWVAECDTLEEAKAPAHRVWGTPGQGARQSIIDGESSQEWVRGDGDPEWSLVNLGATG